MAFLGQVADTWQALIDLIIRPPRHEYSVQRELGTQRLVVKGGLVIREDIEVRDAARRRRRARGRVGSVSSVCGCVCAAGDAPPLAHPRALPSPPR